MREDYEELATEIESILRRSARRLGLTAHSISSRVKELDSFERKASEVDPADPTKPKYASPLDEITDLAGVRVVTFLPATRQEFETLITTELDVIERSDKGAALWDRKQFGYQSIHFLVRLKAPRADLPEYRGMKDMVCEIQVRTIVQHAWAEIEHDIRYKSQGSDLPPEANRRLETIAGVLEMTDREFQSISDEHKAMLAKTRETIQASVSVRAPAADDRGAQAEVAAADIEISGANVRTLVEQAIGEDKRIRPDSWWWTWIARTAIGLGYKNMAELASVIKNFDWDVGAQAHWVTRPSPPSVFEEMLMQADPDRFLERHPLRDNETYMEWWRTHTAEVKTALAARNRGTD